MSIMRKEDFKDNEHAIRALERIEKLEKREYSFTKEQVKQIEMENRLHEYLLTLGINLYMTDDTDDGFEDDSDKNLALMHVFSGRPIPKDLERKLLEKERKRKEREANKNK